MMNLEIPLATSQTRHQCPVCNNAFHIDIIEVHAATCGLRPSDNDCHESSGSGAVGQISTFQSTEEILDWITHQVNETNTFSICVSRSDLFSRGMQQWQWQKKKHLNRHVWLFNYFPCWQIDKQTRSRNCRRRPSQIWVYLQYSLTSEGKSVVSAVVTTAMTQS